jgi:hypothetical protein
MMILLGRPGGGFGGSFPQASSRALFGGGGPLVQFAGRPSSDDGEPGKGHLLGELTVRSPRRSAAMSSSPLCEMDSSHFGERCLLTSSGRANKILTTNCGPVESTRTTLDVEHAGSCAFGAPIRPLFAAAGTQPPLWSAYDQLLGFDSWRRRQGVGGSIPVRFLRADDPGDAGWHISGSFELEGDYWVNVRSKERGLLVLLLLSDVSARDAPTELKFGPHLDVLKLLEGWGDVDLSFANASRRLPTRTLERQSALATDRAGDVFVCHPFLVHRAT